MFTTGAGLSSGSNMKKAK